MRSDFITNRVICLPSRRDFTLFLFIFLRREKEGAPLVRVRAREMQRNDNTSLHLDIRGRP